MRTVGKLVIALLLTGWLSPATASVINLTTDFFASDPLTMTTGPVESVAVGQNVWAGVGIAGLGDRVPPSVGAFDLSLSFNDQLLDAVGVSFFPFLGTDPGIQAGLSVHGFTLRPSVVDFFEVSLLTGVELDALQADSFFLAGILFKTVDVGESTFGFPRIQVADAFGFSLPVAGATATLQTVPVPEPSTLLVLGSGLVGLGRMAWRRPRG